MTSWNTRKFRGIVKHTQSFFCMIFLLNTTHIHIFRMDECLETHSRRNRKKVLPRVRSRDHQRRWTYVHVHVHSIAFLVQKNSTNTRIGTRQRRCNEFDIVSPKTQAYSHTALAHLTLETHTHTGTRGTRVFLFREPFLWRERRKDLLYRRRNRRRRYVSLTHDHTHTHTHTHWDTQIERWKIWFVRNLLKSTLDPSRDCIFFVWSERRNVIHKFCNESQFMHTYTEQVIWTEEMERGTSCPLHRSCGKMVSIANSRNKRCRKLVSDGTIHRGQM